jgi:hypothetical protein
VFLKKYDCFPSIQHSRPRSVPFAGPTHMWACLLLRKFGVVLSRRIGSMVIEAEVTA